MMPQSQETLLAKKMVLETTWNQKYLEQGTETLDMMQIDLELKEIKRKLREQDVLKAREELFSTEEDLDIAS
jgi:hypothetical protein